MKEFKVLKVLDRFRKVFERFGIDYDMMRRILQIKLTLDGRKTPTVMETSTSRKARVKRFSFSLIPYIIFGIILIPIIIFGENYLFQMSLVFGIVMFMMITTLISDFSSVLLDVKDKDIILSKPIESKTLSAAKTAHITIYMFYMTIAFTGASLIAGLIKHGFLFFVVYLIEIILMDIFIVVITALLYLLILKFFDGEKLKDIINYFQITLTLIITVGYQLVVRIFDFRDIINADFTLKPWQYLLPPIWFGSLFELVLKGNTEFQIVILSVLAVIIPIISIIIYNKFTPIFEYNLQKLNESGEGYISRYKGLNNFLSGILCRTKEERVFFKFATNMIKKERNFKLRVYPALGFSIIFPFIFLLPELQEKGLNNEAILNSKIYFSVYFTALIVPNIVSTIGYSENYKGAWIYKVAPISGTRDIFKGTIKACVTHLVVPVYIIVSIIFAIIFKGKIILDLVVVLLSILLFTLICFKITEKRLPFSSSFEEMEKGRSFAVLSLFLMLGIFVGAHYIASLFDYGLITIVIILGLTNIIAWRKGINVELER